VPRLYGRALSIVRHVAAVPRIDRCHREGHAGGGAHSDKGCNGRYHEPATTNLFLDYVGATDCVLDIGGFGFIEQEDGGKDIIMGNAAKPEERQQSLLRYSSPAVRAWQAEPILIAASYLPRAASHCASIRAAVFDARRSYKWARCRISRAGGDTADKGGAAMRAKPNTPAPSACRCRRCRAR
jgi:hypothetical protein